MKSLTFVKQLLCAFVLCALFAGGATAGSPQTASFYATPEEAVAALAQAVQSNDTESVHRILSAPDSRMAASENPAAAGAERAAFLTAYEKKHALIPDGNRFILEIGERSWPFPVPLVQDAKN